MSWQSRSTAKSPRSLPSRFNFNYEGAAASENGSRERFGRAWTPANPCSLWQVLANALHGDWDCRLKNDLSVLTSRLPIVVARRRTRHLNLFGEISVSQQALGQLTGSTCIRADWVVDLVDTQRKLTTHYCDFMDWRPLGELVKSITHLVVGPASQKIG